MTDLETVYLIGGPRDNETVSVARGGMSARLTSPGVAASTIHSVGSETEPATYEYARSPLPDGWPPVFAFASDAGETWPVERVMEKLNYRGKAPPWRSPRA